MKFTATEEITLHFELDGSAKGQPLVFINSLGTDLRSWDAVVEELAADFLCLRYDKRGHGLSDCPPGPYTLSDFSDDLARLVEILGLGQHAVVGISIGGLIAMDYALRFGNELRGLVIADSAAQIGNPEGWQQRIDDVNARGLAEMAAEILPRWFSSQYAEKCPDEYRGYLNMLARQPAAGYTASCAALRDADLRDRVKELDVPTLVLCGEEDGPTPPETCRQLASSLPQAEFAVIPGAGHLPCIEQPAEFARQVRAFAEALQ
jgi:3-oxoadipate enol-lactonase